MGLAVVFLRKWAQKVKKLSKSTANSNKSRIFVPKR